MSKSLKVLLISSSSNCCQQELEIDVITKHKTRMWCEPFKPTYSATFSSSICRMQGQALNKTSKGLSNERKLWLESTLNCASPQRSSTSRKCKDYKKTVTNLWKNLKRHPIRYRDSIKNWRHISSCSNFTRMKVWSRQQGKCANKTFIKLNLFMSIGVLIQCKFCGALPDIPARLDDCSTSQKRIVRRILTDSMRIWEEQIWQMNEK